MINLAIGFVVGFVFAVLLIACLLGRATRRKSVPSIAQWKKVEKRLQKEIKAFERERPVTWRTGRQSPD